MALWAREILARAIVCRKGSDDVGRYLGGWLQACGPAIPPLGLASGFQVSPDRPLSNSQLAMMAARKATAQVGQKRSAGVVTVGEAAMEVGVHRVEVNVAKRILRTASPAIVSAVESGRLSLHSAMKIMQQPAAAQSSILEKVLAQGKKRLCVTAAARATMGTNKIFKRLPTRPLAERMTRALDQIENTAYILRDWLDGHEAKAHHEAPGWIKRLAETRAVLSKTINAWRDTHGQDERR